MAMIRDCPNEGDTFEIEDQRNWTDASCKTYVRPLALPWPYTIAQGGDLDQSLTLTVSGSPMARRGGGGNVIHLRLGRAQGRVPELGLGLDHDEAQAALANGGALSVLNVAHFIGARGAGLRRGERTLARQSRGRAKAREYRSPDERQLAGLDAEGLAAALRDPGALDHLEQAFNGEEIELDAHAVARLRFV